jgi:Tfp pilus assembly protein PilX
MMRRLLRDQQGIALVMALGVLITLTITTLALLTYTTSNVRGARYGHARVSAYSLAEAGINDALAVLNLSTNNAMNTNLLPSTTTSFDGGTATRSGVLNTATATWTITSTGSVKNPTGASNVTKTLKVNVPITPSLSGALNNPAWNYIYSYKPNDGNSSTCEMTITNSVSVATPLYVEGDLCINNTANVVQGSHGTTLVVKGQLTLSNKNQNYVGSTGSPITSAYIGTGCKLQNNAVHSPCGSADNVWASTIGTTPPNPISPPTVDWDGWYNAAAPGPKFGCVAARSSAPSTWPTFDNDTTRNKSVTTAFNLTPSTSYDCWTDGGELAWNATTKVLTVSGVVFIDGSAEVQNGYVNAYSGMGSLYLSGTMLIKNSKLCAIVLSDGSACDTTNWDPNTKALIIVTNGNADNGLPTGDSVQLVSGYLQGGIYASNTIEIDTTSNVDGPMVGNVVILGQSVNTSFPFISFVPNGTPGNQIVYAQPSPPTGYDG